MSRDRYELERLADGLASITIAEPVSELHISRHAEGLTITGTLADGSDLLLSVRLAIRGCGDLSGLLGERLEVVLMDPVVEPVDKPMDNTDNIVSLRGMG